MMDSVSTLLVKQMDLAAARHKVLAHDLANSGTAGYKPGAATFESALSQASEAEAKGAGNGQEAAAAGGAEAAAAPGAQAQDGAAYAASAESLEMQMARLDDNTGRFSALARLLSIRERVYETALRGR